jgi:hypothetical protein
VVFFKKSLYNILFQIFINIILLDSFFQKKSCKTLRGRLDPFVSKELKSTYNERLFDLEFDIP